MKLSDLCGIYQKKCGYCGLWHFLAFAVSSPLDISLQHLLVKQYKGDPDAPPDSEAYQAYAQGVRIGSWGLALEGALMSIVSLFQDKLANLIGLKRLFIIVQCSFVVVTMGLTMHVVYDDNVVVVIILGGLSGPYMGVLLSIPFTLVAMYEVCAYVYPY